VGLVFIFMAYNLQSFFLATYCISLVAAAFPVTQLIYLKIANIKVYILLHLLCLFFGLGISMESMIYYNSTWKWTGRNRILRKSLKRRMAYTFRQSTFNNFLAMSVTVVSCLSLVFSSISIIRSFGYYAAIFMASTFIITVIMLPPMIAFWENNITNPLNDFIRRFTIVR
jgi:predicted RND superfamily exporter protein